CRRRCRYRRRMSPRIGTSASSAIPATAGCANWSWSSSPNDAMRMLVAGAGPAGLYLAYLVKRQLPEWEVRVVEQNARDSTFGFGVVFSERALEFLRADDPETYDRITPAMEAWTDITVVLRGVPVVIDGIGFSAIGRLKFLRLLCGQLEAAGVSPLFSHALPQGENLKDFDLVVAADGANSVVRRT